MGFDAGSAAGSSWGCFSRVKTSIWAINVSHEENVGGRRNKEGNLQEIRSRTPPFVANVPLIINTENMTIVAERKHRYKYAGAPRRLHVLDADRQSV